MNLFFGRLKTLRSGPSSMIELEEYDEDDGSSMFIIMLNTLIYTYTRGG